MGVLVDGCGTSSRIEAYNRGFMRVVSPRPPGFLTGSLAVLFTNWPGFSAQADLQVQNSLNVDRTSSGQLFGRGTKLLYAPQSGETTDTHRQPGRYSFIWDVAEASGYVLSDALQGYAPISSNLRVTSLALAPGQVAAQKISGHPCERTRATLQLSDGSISEYELFRATDLNGFPVQISSITNVAFTLTLSKIRFEQPPADAFSPPDGFTKYPTPEALSDELAARQNNLRRKSSDEMPLTPTPERRY
jgi:hypothetical protein